MTREEVIKWFKENPFMHKDHEPFQMAIEALEKENNAIDRVLEIIDDMCRDEETGYVISRKMVYVLASELRDRVLALKEGEQK